MEARATSTTLVSDTDVRRELSPFYTDKNQTAQHIVKFHKFAGLVWDTKRLEANQNETELVSELFPSEKAAKEFHLMICNHEPVMTLSTHFKVFESRNPQTRHQFRVVVDLIKYGNELSRINGLNAMKDFLNAVHNSSKNEFWEIDKKFGALRYTHSNQGYLFGALKPEEIFDINVFSKRAISFGFTPKLISAFTKALQSQSVKTCTVYFLNDADVLNELFHLAIPYNYFHKHLTQNLTATLMNTTFAAQPKVSFNKRKINELDIDVPKITGVIPKDITDMIAFYLTYADLLNLLWLCKATASAAKTSFNKSIEFRKSLALFTAPKPSPSSSAPQQTQESIKVSMLG